MALSDAILVLLTEQPMSGYDLAKAFDTSIGFFWKADHQQIYRELGRLKDKGLVAAEEVVQSGRPNKLIYTITADGLAALKAWSRKPGAAAAIKDDLLVRLYALDQVDPGAMREQLSERYEYHADRLRRFEAILQRGYADGAPTLRQLGRLLGLKMGLRYEQACADWCQDALDALKSPPGGAVTALPAYRLNANRTAKVTP